MQAPSRAGLVMRVIHRPDATIIVSREKRRYGPLVGHRPERSPFQKAQIVCEALVARARQREFGPRPPPFDHPRRMAAAAQRRPDERGGGYGVEGWCS